MRHSEWLDKLAPGESIRSIAQRVDMPQRTLANQVEKERISAENVIHLAIELGAHPVGALVDTDYLDEKWAKTISPEVAIRSVTEEFLSDEVLRRMKVGPKTDTFTTPVDELAARREMEFDAELDVAASHDQDADRYGADDDDGPLP